MSSISLLTQAKALGELLIRLPIHHFEEVACELSFAPYPGWGLGWMRIRLPFHHLEEVACKLNLAPYPGWGLGWITNKVADSPPRGGGLRAQSWCRFFEPALLPWDDTHSVCTLPSHLGFARSIWAIDHCALFRGSCYYPEMIHVQFALYAFTWCSVIQSAWLIIVLSLELMLLSSDDTRLVCALCSHLGFAHSICLIDHRAFFGAITSNFQLSSKNIIMIMFYVLCPSKFYGDIRAFELL